MTTKPVIRCAVYTRKSSEEGLDQSFNSLDAQFEACAAYIASQKHEGWKLAAERYDDGGISGGKLERPALRRLLADIAAGRITMIVVYKIDRLTRSLADFSKLVERFEASGCSFVSVTQAFNTASSMGSLTLNVLLSFAQFEREVTAERIRDKIAGSKKKGLWMGGMSPLGYDRDPDPMVRGLVVNTAEAEQVQLIFNLYDQRSCLRKVEVEAHRLGLRSKLHQSVAGKTRGNAILTRGMLHHLLTNPIYRGLIRHKQLLWPGQHDAIVSEELWDRVQAKLIEKSARPRGPAGSLGDATSSPLGGKLRDETGDRLTPTHTQRHGKHFRYYVSSRLLKGTGIADPSAWRLPARALDAAVANLVAEHLQRAAIVHKVVSTPDMVTTERISRAVDPVIADLRDREAPTLAALIDTVRVGRDHVAIQLDRTALATRLTLPPDALDDALLAFEAPFSLRRRGIEAKIIAGSLATTADPNLHKTLLNAHRWLSALKSNRSITEIAGESGHSESYIRTRLALALLSPRIQAAILNGSIGPAIMVDSVVHADLPSDWAKQEQRLGLPPR